MSSFVVRVFVGMHTQRSVLLPVSAGSCVAFSSLLWHRSPPNRSRAPRRAFYAQFSARPVAASLHAREPIAFAVPLGPAAAPSAAGSA